MQKHQGASFVSRLSTAVLLLINAGLVGLVWFVSSVEWAADTEQAPRTSLIAANGPRPTTQSLPPVPTASQLETTLSRPLFLADRRPPVRLPTADRTVETAVPKSVVPPPVPGLPADLRLVGIVVSSAKGTYAVLRSADNPRGVSLVVGDVLADWRVVEIRPGDVVLEAAGQRRVLSLFAATRVATPATARKP